MMIYVISKDDKPVKIVFKGGKGSNPIVEDDRVYVIDERSSPEEAGKALKTLYDRLMSESTLVDDHAYPDEASSPRGN